MRGGGRREGGREARMKARKGERSRKVEIERKKRRAYKGMRNKMKIRGKKLEKKARRRGREEGKYVHSTTSPPSSTQYSHHGPTYPYNRQHGLSVS